MMPSIFDIPPSENGGGVARSGFWYQDHVAIGLLLEMLRKPEMVAVSCETHDDLLVEYSLGEMRSVEFVQVKSDAPDQLWTISLLCQGEGDSRSSRGVETSPLARQLSRDRGSEPSRFRFVTLRDVKGDLAILKTPAHNRLQADCERLASLLESKVGTIRSPAGHDLAYWVSNAFWEVAESVESVAHGNLVQLQDWCESELGILGSFSAFTKLYDELLMLVSGLARAKGDGNISRRIAREELREWLTDRTSTFSQVQSRVHSLEIGRLEKESLARCEELWLSLSVPDDEAWLLSRNSNFGKADPGVFQRGETKFTWFIAAYGSGKTLLMERAFQVLLSNLRTQIDAPAPVFIKAKKLTRQLRQEMEFQLQRLGRGVENSFLILDAVDECGTERAADLLLEAHSLSRTLENLAVFVTSTPLPIPGFTAEEMVQLPLLSERDALALVSHFARWKQTSLWNLPLEIQEACSSPLFATLLGLSLRDSFRQPHSTGELLDSLVKRALRPYTNERLRPSVDHLIRLAELSTDAEGQPVPATTLSLSSFEIQPLLQSRLVKLEENSLSFSVSLIRCWFAAEAIRSGKISVDAVLEDARRFELWRVPLATYLSNCAFEESYNILPVLAQWHPARASLLLDDAFAESRMASQQPGLTPEELGQQLIKAFNLWREGLGPLSVGVLPCYHDGGLLPLKIFNYNSTLTAVWVEDKLSPPLEIRTEAPEQFIFNPRVGHQAWFNLGARQPGWVWPYTRRHIGEQLEKILDKLVLPVETGVIAREAEWAAACERIGFGAHSPEEISISSLQTRRSGLWRTPKNERILQALQARCAAEGVASIRSPYPQKDREVVPLRFGDFGFSPERYAQRGQAVFKAALDAYRDLVETWFWRFRDRLPLYVAHPVEIRGGVCSASGHSWPQATCVGYRIFPRTSGTQSVVSIAYMTPEQLREIASNPFPDRLKGQEPPFFIGERYSESIREQFCHETPATRLAFDWVKHDLQSVKWIKR